jgi:DNA polymerase III subunit delta'
MQFSTIIAQEPVKKQLAEMMQSNRLAHALLFLGKEGSGALQLAIAFAQYVVCEKTGGKQPAVGNQQSESSLFGDLLPAQNLPAGRQGSELLTNDSCGTCSGCKKANDLVHPDIHFSYPVVTKKSGTPPISTDYITEWREFIKGYPYGNVYDWLQFIGAENKQGNITAHECNDIIKKLSLKSFESPYKILILWMPEYLEKEGNKLLKIIEEPPPNTLFILVAENESLILPTIVSRCQLVKIPMLETKEIEAALVSRNNTDATKARQVAATSDGNYRDALQQLQHADEDWQSLLRDWLNAILKTGPAAQTKWVEEISRLGREKQKQFLRYFNHLLEQSIHLRITDTGVEVSVETDFANRINKIADIAQQQAIVEELDKAVYYIERNANSKMLFHALTIKLYHIIKNKIVLLAD